MIKRKAHLSDSANSPTKEHIQHVTAEGKIMMANMAALMVHKRSNTIKYPNPSQRKCQLKSGAYTSENQVLSILTVVICTRRRENGSA